MNLDSMIADLPETSVIDKMSLKVLKEKAVEEQTKYEVNKTRFGAYVTICTDNRVFCLPITEVQMEQIYAIGGEFIEQLKSVFKCQSTK